MQRWNGLCTASIQACLSEQSELHRAIKFEIIRHSTPYKLAKIENYDDGSCRRHDLHSARASLPFTAALPTLYLVQWYAQCGGKQYRYDKEQNKNNNNNKTITLKTSQNHSFHLNSIENDLTRYGARTMARMI